MLVIISDLHLTDGTTGSSIGASAFREFCDRLRDMVIDASWRDNRAAQLANPDDHTIPSKIYKPIDSFNIILLGDILDVIRSTLWTDGDDSLRPWPDSDIDDWETLLASRVDEITDRILAQNHEALACLRELTPPRQRTGTAPKTVHETEDGKSQLIQIDYKTRNPIKIPPATEAGDVDYHAKHQPVYANIYYFIGNHDWFYYVEGEAYDAIRAKLVEAFGLAHSEKPFPWDMTRENFPDVKRLLRDHKVFARHGDVYDEFNFHHKIGRRDYASLGDAMVIDLINPFPPAVHKKLRHRLHLPPFFEAGLREIANVRPLESLPAWLDNLLLRFGEGRDDKALQQDVKDQWDLLARRLLSLDFVKDQDRWGLDAVDKLQILLRLINPIDEVGLLTRTAKPVFDYFHNNEEKYAEHALAEPWLEAGSANYVVYGHTHKQVVVPLGTRGDERLIYFNTGTWKRVHEESRYGKRGQRFVDFSVMSYVAFFKDDERSGRPFETWTGTLGNRK